MYIKDAFTKFTKERHAEDKGRNHDLLQEIYASTEFFDMTLCEFKDEMIKNFSTQGNKCRADFTIENFSLPFQNCFIKACDIEDEAYLFVREYSPDVITGTVYEMHVEGNCVYTYNVPFTIRISPFQSYILADKLKELSVEDMKNYLDMVTSFCEVLNNLSKKQVAVDTDTSGHSEYYRRKRKPTIKIPQRPIYYVLGDKKENVTKKYNSIKSMGRLEYTNSFHVRGHWRTINEKSLGKDRNGNYGVHGYTWVTDYIKGEGELTKRLRVIK